MNAMPFPFKQLALMALMGLAAVAAWAFRPTILLADQRAKVELAQLVPKQFGDWRELSQSVEQIVNPQQTALLQKIYSQILSRTYIHTNGKVVMLSISYGSNQSDGVALHYPEVCYPAQGFQLLATTNSEIRTDFGNFTVRHIMTQLGNRHEPLTYWSTMGDKIVQRGINTKLVQLGYGFRGLIPDGLIFRVSSIDTDPVKGYEAQASFVRALITAIPTASRVRLTGLSG